MLSVDEVTVAMLKDEAAMLKALDRLPNAWVLAYLPHSSKYAPPEILDDMFGTRDLVGKKDVATKGFSRIWDNGEVGGTVGVGVVIHKSVSRYCDITIIRYDSDSILLTREWGSGDIRMLNVAPQIVHKDYLKRYPMMLYRGRAVIIM